MKPLHEIVREHAAGQLNYETRLGIVVFYCLASSVLLYFRRKSAPGWPRAPFALAIVTLNLLVPALFHIDLEVCTLAVLGLDIMWLGSFKVLGWALGRGPLTEPLTLPQFIAVASLPITPVLSKSAAAPKGNARQGETGDGALGAAADFGIKVVALAVIVKTLQKPDLPPMFAQLLYAVGLYCFVGLVMALVGVLCVGLLGMRVAPHFDRPYLSSSLTDFWSRRWNLNTGYTLRFLVYDPVCHGEELGGVIMRSLHVHIAMKQSYGRFE